jgi:glycosyltransferase involved in cell wall biosynthesis
MEAYKGLSYFIAAVQELDLRGFTVKGVIAGRGSDLDRHRNEIDESSLFEIHAGFVTREKLTELFKRANVVVLPYTDGTQSGVAAMALGFERPVVASKVGGIPEMVRDGVNGYLIPPKDLESLVEALVRLIEDQSLAVKMADNASALCSGENSWGALAGKTASVYENALCFRGTSNAN